MMENTEGIRKHILKRLRMTRQNETICLMDWEARCLVAWIEELERRMRNEPVDDHR